MFKQAIWVLAIFGRHMCQAVLDVVEDDHTNMDDPLGEVYTGPLDRGLFWDATGLLGGDGPVGDVKTGLIDVKTVFSPERDSEHV